MEKFWYFFFLLNYDPWEFDKISTQQPQYRQDSFIFAVVISSVENC